MKTTKPNRLIKFMEQIRWKGKDNWSEIKEEYVTPEILPFKSWIVNHLKYIQTEKAREAVRTYFLVGESNTPHSGFYIDKDRGVEALVAMYALERDND